jgi:hypothetical protein
MISSRFVPAICALFALALVPTLLHSYSDTVVDDGRSVTAIDERLGSLVSVPSDRNPTWGKRRFDSDEWIERIYSGGDVKGHLRLTVVRTFDAKSVYHHPELAVAYGTSFTGSEIRHFPERPEIPVHVLRSAQGVPSAAMYVLHYDDRYVANPIAFQLRLAGELLVSRRKPMTLFFIVDERGSNVAARTQLLFTALDSFQRL